MGKPSKKLSQAGKQDTKSTFRRGIHWIFDIHSKMVLYTQAVMKYLV